MNIGVRPAFAKASDGQVGFCSRQTANLERYNPGNSYQYDTIIKAK